MKTRFWISFQWLSVLCLAVWAVGPRALAETQAGLAVQTYAGLTITGAVGTVYTVQYTTDLAQSNDWRAAGIVQLPGSPYLWVDTTAPATGRRFYRAVEGPVNLAWIPPGTFTMGSPTNELEREIYISEGPQTVVTLTRGFFMGKHEVTQGEYVEIVGNNPSYFRNGTRCCGGNGDLVTNELLRPVESVTWHHATNYCTRLIERERTAGRLPAGWVYRLPTEAEWEYGCRSGTTSPFHYGPVLRSGMANFNGRQEYDSRVGTVTNASGSVLGQTTAVGSYEPNGWGLYDMCGNVAEWCLDWGLDTGGLDLPGGRVIDPQGIISNWYHVFRGGSFNTDASQCRSARRIVIYDPDDIGRFSNFGFRAVLAPGQ
jgi:formylglycine-generating enzyme required for sulfatase activity